MPSGPFTVLDWTLLAGVIFSVLLFGSSTALAAAYGISVSLVMVMTTILTFFVIRYGWGYPLWLCAAATGFFFVVDVAFFASNSIKIMQGGWFPLTMALALYFVLSTWKDGRALLSAKIREEALELHSFLNAVFLDPPQRVSGTAIFLSGEPGTLPNALLHNLKHNKVLHEYNVFVTVRAQEVPRVDAASRLETHELGNGCWQVIVKFGFMDTPDVPLALQSLCKLGCPLEPMSTSYFLSRDTVIPTVGGGMSPWREKFFGATSQCAV